jgi:uncharacterized short protein YbdD (DUF466 family)
MILWTAHSVHSTAYFSIVYRLRKLKPFKTILREQAMSVARELTPEEVKEGERGINTEQLSATQIQALARRMDASKKKWKYLKQRGAVKEYEEALKKENELLYFNYPSLFQMHAEDRLDATFFELLQLKRKIEKGEITPEEASVVVGQKLYNKYIPHVIGQSAEPPAPTMSYEDYYRSQE